MSFENEYNELIRYAKSLIKIRSSVFNEYDLVHGMYEQVPQKGKEKAVIKALYSKYKCEFSSKEYRLDLRNSEIRVCSKCRKEKESGHFVFCQNYKNRGYPYYKAECNACAYVRMKRSFGDQEKYKKYRGKKNEAGRRHYKRHKSDKTWSGIRAACRKKYETKGRKLLSDSYIRREIYKQTGLKVAQVTDAMIIEKREAINKYREKKAQNGIKKAA